MQLIHARSTRASVRSSTTRQTTRRIRNVVPHAAAAAAIPTPKGDVISVEDTERVSRLQDLFRSADQDGNGVIDREELRRLLGTLEGGYAATLTTIDNFVSDEDVDSAMARFDRDQSGTIDFNEFQQLVYDGLLLEGTLCEYEAAFRAVDASGNGTIGATELRQLFASLGQPLSMDKLCEIMMQYDKDESGQIEFGEFLSMFRSQLLDLGAMQAWMGENPQLLESQPDLGLLQPPTGAVSVVFSQEEVQDALEKAQAAGRAAVLFCGLTWCRPCKAVGRAYERLADAYPGVTFLKLYGNANSSCKRTFKLLKVRSTPAFVVFRDGDVVATTTGANKAKFEAALRSVLQESEMPAEPVYELEQPLAV